MRVPHEQGPGRRMQELRGYRTTTAQLLEMVAWLRDWRVQRVVMESTSAYWKGVYHLLEPDMRRRRPVSSPQSSPHIGCPNISAANSR